MIIDGYDKCSYGNLVCHPVFGDNAINSHCVMLYVNTVTNWYNGYYSVLAWFTSCWCVNRLRMAMDRLRMDCRV